MSEELQNETLTLNTESNDITETASNEAIENSQEPDLATENEVNSEVIADTPEQIEAKKEVKRQDAFNKQYGEKKQAERERDAANARIAELEQANQPEQPQDVGEFPSEYDYDTDEEYKTAKTDFVSRVQKAEQYKHQQNAQSDYTQNQQAREQQQQQEKFNTDLQAYTKSAETLGIDRQELQEAANAVNRYGITPNLSLAILEDPDGPLMTKYLAANPQEVTRLVNMNPYTAGAHLANLRSKAAALKPKTSSTPKPTADITGSSPKPPKHPELEGVIYS